METSLDWIGSKPQKFRGGIQITRYSPQQSYNILSPPCDFSMKSIDNKASKRHFPMKLSPVNTNIRSSDYILHSNPAEKRKHADIDYFLNPSKKTSEKVPKNLSKVSNFNKHKKKYHFTKTEKHQIKSQRDQVEVLKLDDWEERVMRTCVSSPDKHVIGFNSRTDRCAARLSQIMRNKLFC